MPLSILLKHFAALTTVTLSSKPDRQGCGRKLNGNAWLGWWGSHDLDQKRPPTITHNFEKKKLPDILLLTQTGPNRDPFVYIS